MDNGTVKNFYSFATKYCSHHKPLAKHIIDLDIDERLAAGDVTLVNEIARVDMDNGTVKNFYSFATKYCSHHKLNNLECFFILSRMTLFNDISVIK
jgi:hypothetical protein